MKKGQGKLINVSRFGLLASVDLTDNHVNEGDSIGVNISMPNRDETVLCEGIVRHVEQKDNVWFIGVEIKVMDPSAKFEILEIAYKAWGKKRHEHV